MAESVSSEAAEAPFITTRWTGAIEAVRSRAYWLTISFLTLVVVAGTAAGVHAKLIGSLEAYGATREIPWGILISTYVFFVVTSTGLCLVSSIGHVFGVKDFMPIAKRSVFLAVATIVAGFFVIFFEIENPFRMAIYNVISPNLTSNIWWMGTLYGAYMVFMAVEFMLLVKGNYRLATIIGFIGVVAGVAAHSNLGAVFGMLDGREFWYGPFMPIYFITSAMMSGSGAIMLFTWLAYKVNGEQMEPETKRALEVTTKVGILLISAILFFTAWKFIIGFAGGEAKIMALEALLTGPYAFNFWVLEIGVGMIIPLVLYIQSKGKNLSLMALASAMMIFGIFFMRYDLVIVGQVVPLQYDLKVNEYQGLLSYTPSWHEIAVVLGGIALVGLIFLLGEKAFGGHRVEAHEGGEH
ncbi:MAG: polysulfide reductase NrfD [Thermoleophilia bacterium]|nr:polysulfide reductase NrfD [Thermoleophilia bacterium]